jgi:hypothetical protein
MPNQGLGGKAVHEPTMGVTMQHNLHRRNHLIFRRNRCRCGVRWPCPDGLYDFSGRQPVPDGAAGSMPRTPVLIHAIADTLESHGHPPIADGPDLDRLGAALAHFLRRSTGSLRR